MVFQEQAEGCCESVKRSIKSNEVLPEMDESNTTGN